MTETSRRNIFIAEILLGIACILSYYFENQILTIILTGALIVIALIGVSKYLRNINYYKKINKNN